MTVDAQSLRATAVAMIQAFDVELGDLTLLTEAASGPFVVTPIVAAMAGADRVVALAADSPYGSAAEVEDATRALATSLGVNDRIEVVSSRDDDAISGVDVITNLGFVRPIDAALLDRAGEQAVVSLMCEPWEVRAADVDLAACRARSIPVLGTNEDDPRLRMFRYLPDLAAMLIEQLGVPSQGASVALLSSGKFANALAQGLSSRGAFVEAFAPPLSRSDEFEESVADADALVIADYPGGARLVGGDAAYSAADLAAINADLRIAHIAGGIDHEEVDSAGLRHAPAKFAPAGTMSVTAGSLGHGPVVELHSAGLKVGEALARARREGLTGAAAEAKVLETLPLALGVDDPGETLDDR